MDKSERRKGISLIVLVITIVVIVILVGAIVLSISNNNPIKQASEAVFRNDITTMKEQYAVEYITALGRHKGSSDLIEIGDFSNNLVPGKYSDSLMLTVNGIMIKKDNTFTEEELKIAKEILGDADNGQTEISKDPDKSKSYVGYYADIDGDKTVDGIIYADLVTGAVGDGQCGDDNGNYIIPTISSSESKNYYISQEAYEGTFGTKPVLSQISGTTGEDRFYVMALKEKGTYCWYDTSSDYTDISADFGTGKSNTDKMIKKWNAQVETQNTGAYDDVWGIIQTEVEKGWYLASKAEWAAFGGEILERMGIIDKDSFGKLGFGPNSAYWTSSQYSNEVCVVYFNDSSLKFMGYSTAEIGNTRLVTNF